MAPAEMISEEQTLRQEYQKTVEALQVAQKEAKEMGEQHKQRITKMTDAHAQVLAALQEQMRNAEAKHQKEIIMSRMQQSDTIKAELERMAAGIARVAELLESKDDKEAYGEVMTTQKGNGDEYGTVPKNAGNAVSQSRKELAALQTTFQRLVQLTSPIDHQQDKTGFAEHRPQPSANKNIETEVVRLEIGRRQEV
ncbi:hypothetical protein BJV82DRAFT_630712 [Fennellomyces sp. T-0311]|nr:hypothetical protein BJV82DRAFT_630712 [Fennellomyces sp. T-0311]